MYTRILLHVQQLYYNKYNKLGRVAHWSHALANPRVLRDLRQQPTGLKIKYFW